MITGLPVPGETSLIACTILASQHQGISIELVIAVAALGAIIGDNVGYVLAQALLRSWERLARVVPRISSVPRPPAST
jgi:membrane protein DedA with SNARE-associated domain